MTYFGPGERKELPNLIARLGFKKAMIVTDKGLIKFVITKMVCDVLKEEDIPALAVQAISDVCTPGNPREVH